jgi:hypothetical protein
LRAGDVMPAIIPAAATFIASTGVLLRILTSFFSPRFRSVACCSVRYGMRFSAMSRQVGSQDWRC